MNEKDKKIFDSITLPLVRNAGGVRAIADDIVAVKPMSYAEAVAGRTEVDVPYEDRGYMGIRSFEEMKQRIIDEMKSNNADDYDNIRASNGFTMDMQLSKTEYKKSYDTLTATLYGDRHWPIEILSLDPAKWRLEDIEQTLKEIINENKKL